MEDLDRALPPIRLAYIRRVLRFIEKSDTRMFNMLTFGVHSKRGEAVERPECGTTCCFAGWGYLLQYPKREWNSKFQKNGYFKIDSRVTKRGDTATRAARLFGFTPSEATSVFCGYAYRAGGTWLEQFNNLKLVINQVLERRGMTERV